MPEVDAEVAGVQHSNPCGSRRWVIARKYCKPGVAVILRRQPENPHDKNAVAVCVEASQFFGVFQSKKQIGFLKKRLAARLAPKIDAGESVTAIVKTTYLPPTGYQRVSLKVSY